MSFWCCKRKRKHIQPLDEENELPPPTSPFPSQLRFPSFKKQNHENQDPEAEQDEKVNKTPLQYLQSNSFQSLPLWSLEGEKTHGKVTRVLDGDTIEIVILNHDQVQKHQLRLLGIDAPELRPRKTVADRELQIRAAEAVSRYLSKIVAGSDNIVWVEFSKKDKYGRWLGEIFTENKDAELENLYIRTSINKLLLTKHFVKTYNGGARQLWSRKELLDILSQLSKI
jgi:endonuclease YncB( thermonuclease family)